jgi:hypothetical protein
LRAKKNAGGRLRQGYALRAPISGGGAGAHGADHDRGDALFTADPVRRPLSHPPAHRRRHGAPPDRRAGRNDKENEPMTSPPQNQSGATQAGASSSSAQGNGHDTRQTAHELGEKAKVEGKARVEDLRETAAGNVDRLAESVQAAASRLAEDDVAHMSEYISRLADGMGRFSSSLREKSGDELLRDIGRLARENPALFVTGSIAIGFGLGRFARASQHSTQSSQSSQLQDSATGSDGSSTWSSQPTATGMSGGSASMGGVTSGSSVGATSPAAGTGSGSASVSRPGTPGNPGPATPGSTTAGTRGGTH